jgi:hypothetical protein
MSQEDDEFKDVKMGLPSGTTAQSSSIKFIALFTIVGIIIATVVLGFGKMIADILREISENENMPAQILMTSLLSLLVGGLQAVIFRSKIRSRWHFFIAFSLLGGIAGGFVGGFLLDSGMSASPAVIGAINGFLAGGISSLAQNKLMNNVKYSIRWFLYNSISWAVIFSIAWIIGWQRGNFTNVAIAAAFLMTASGVSLAVFLRGTPQIEFS